MYIHSPTAHILTSLRTHTHTHAQHTHSFVDIAHTYKYLSYVPYLRDDVNCPIFHFPKIG